jgi:hypothetical protein
MSSSTLYRASGLALLLGAALLIIGYIPLEVLTAGNDPHQYLTPMWVVVSLVSLLGEMLFLMGLPGIVPRVGRLGFVGFVLTFLGGLLFAGTSVVNLLVFPWLAQVAPTLAAGPPAFLVFFLVAGVLFALGGILLGIATLRAGILPRFAVALLIVGVVLNFVGILLTGIIATIVAIVAFVFFALPFGWMGYALMSERHVEVTRAEPASALKSVG